MTNDTTAQATVLTVEELEKRLAYNWVDTLRWLADRDRALTEQVRVLEAANRVLTDGLELFAEGSAYITNIAPRWERDYWRLHVSPTARDVLQTAQDEAEDIARSALAALEGES